MSYALKSTGILQEIGESVKAAVEVKKNKVPESSLKELASSRVSPPKDFCVPFGREGLNVIAEVKKASPSQGPIAPELDHVTVASDYLKSGAQAISVLTEPKYFGGDVSFLQDIRKAHPEAYLLMKDFFVDSYQLQEALAFGADAILIIVSLLGPEQSGDLYKKAMALGLTPLVEVHDAAEMDAAIDFGAQLIGINNRDLKTLKTSIDTSFSLIKKSVSKCTFIAESGLNSHEQLVALNEAGCHGFLVGTSLMKTGTPGMALKRLLGAG